VLAAGKHWATQEVLRAALTSAKRDSESNPKSIAATRFIRYELLRRHPHRLPARVGRDKVLEKLRKNENHWCGFAKAIRVDPKDRVAISNNQREAVRG